MSKIRAAKFAAVLAAGAMSLAACGGTTATTSTPPASSPAASSAAALACPSGKLVGEGATSQGNAIQEYVWDAQGDRKVLETTGHVVFVDVLPVTTNGKIAKQALREQLRERFTP